MTCRLAICQCELGELEKARESIDMAKSIDGSNPDIDELYMKVNNTKNQLKNIYTKFILRY